MPARPAARPRILVGVSGGIAAYKTLELVRLIRRAGWDCVAVMTAAARRFVGPESFRSLTGNPVALDLFPKTRPASGVQHVDLATSADAVIVAPATANIIGKLAAGIADDLLSTVLLAVPPATVKAGRVIFAPAMNTNMWQHPAVGRNIALLEASGYRFVAPGSGELACGTTGPGRMAEPAAIFAALRAALAPAAAPLAGRRIVVTAGRTEEPLDPVRIITNRSSGRMGVELARALADAGARVTLVAGAMQVPPPAGVRTVAATSTGAMLRAVLRETAVADALVMCAAVADYRPARPARDKRHDAELVVRLERTPNILAAVAAARPRLLLVGFSLDDSVPRARRKLAARGLDLIVQNPFATAGSDSIRPRLIFRTGRPRRLAAMPKPDFARELARTVSRLLDRKKAK